MDNDKTPTTKDSPKKSEKATALIFLPWMTFSIMMSAYDSISNMVIPSHYTTLYLMVYGLVFFACFLAVCFLNKRYWLLLSCYTLFLLLINVPIFLNFILTEKDTYTEYALIKEKDARHNNLLLEFSNGECEISPKWLNHYNYHRGEYVKVELRNALLYPIIVDYDTVSVKKEFLEKHQ